MAAAAGGAPAAAPPPADLEAQLRQASITFPLKPAEGAKFSASAVRKVVDEYLRGFLAGKTWVGESDEESLWSEAITNEVKKRVKELAYPRYKIVVQTVIGQAKSQGVRVASRCLWDPESDNFASVTVEADGIWATVMVFGVYTE